VSLRNSLVPLFSFTSLVLVLVAHRFIKQKKRYLQLVCITIIGLSVFDYSIFANKYLPFSEPLFMFPESAPFQFINLLKTSDRFYWDYTVHVGSNIWIPERLFGVVVYDSLYSVRYGQLVAASKNGGNLSDSIPRSDANLASNTDDFYRRRLQNVLG